MDNGAGMAELVSIILAAGEGTRMRSAMPKVLHPVGGMPIIGHVVRAAVAAGSSGVGVVTAPGHQDVRDTVAGIFPSAQFFEQTERRGTAHAARIARPLRHPALPACARPPDIQACLRTTAHRTRHLQTLGSRLGC